MTHNRSFSPNLKKILENFNNIFLNIFLSKDLLPEACTLNGLAVTLFQFEISMYVLQCVV
jgi:hypothetical protein